MPGRSEVLMIRPEEWEKDGKSRSMDDTHAKIMCYIYIILYTLYLSHLWNGLEDMQVVTSYLNWLKHLRQHVSTHFKIRGWWLHPLKTLLIKIITNNLGDTPSNIYIDL